MKIVYLFWTEECHRCQLFKPVFEGWAAKFKGADFVSVPLDDAHIARKLNISSVPTVVVIEGERILAFFRRAPTEQEIARLLMAGDNPDEGDITEAPSGEEGG